MNTKNGTLLSVVAVLLICVSVGMTSTNTPPVASFTYSPENPVVDQTITFNASGSYDPDGGNITKYKWNFGAGNIANTKEETITHIYSSVGNYTVKLIVTDDNGTKNSTSKEITVRVPDTTPPSNITNLTSTTGTTWINWMWTNPTDYDFSHTMVYLNGTWQANTSDAYYNATELIANTSYEIGTHTVDTNGNVNTMWMNQTAKTEVAPDTIPPASIYNLQNNTGTTWINWTWNNPTDADFSHTMVYLNGVWQTNTSDAYYNATGLNASTNYEIATRTVDKVGNVNETWVNDTATTLPDTTPPASITNLTNITGNFWINWTWNNPLDTDFNHTMIYINGTFKTNTSDAYYNATGLNAGTDYEIATRTADNVGNINETWINDTATTLPVTTSPTVLSTSPANDATNVDINTKINVTFNGLMNETSVKNAFSISPTVEGAINWVGNTMIFVSSSNLAYSKAYTVTINASIAKDLAGNFLDGNKNGTVDGSPIDDYVWSFTTKKASSTEEKSDGGGGGGGGTVSNVPTDSKGVVRYTVTLTSRDESAFLKIRKGTTVLDAQGNPLTSPINILSPPFEGAVAAYDLRPNDVKFEPAVEFSINYDPAKIPEGTTESELVIKVYENDTWMELETTVNVTTHTASTMISHFTVFALFAEVASTSASEVRPMLIPTPSPTSAPTPTPTPTPTPPFPQIRMFVIVIAIVAVMIISIYFLIL
jgi:PKD repeat protein